MFQKPSRGVAAYARTDSNGMSESYTVGTPVALVVPSRAPPANRTHSAALPPPAPVSSSTAADPAVRPLPAPPADNTKRAPPVVIVNTKANTVRRPPMMLEDAATPAPPQAGLLSSNIDDDGEDIPPPPPLPSVTTAAISAVPVAVSAKAFQAPPKVPAAEASVPPVSKSSGSSKGHSRNGSGGRWARAALVTTPVTAAVPNRAPTPSVALQAKQVDTARRPATARAERNEAKESTARAPLASAASAAKLPPSGVSPQPITKEVSPFHPRDQQPTGGPPPLPAESNSKRAPGASPANTGRRMTMMQENPLLAVSSDAIAAAAAASELPTSSARGPPPVPSHLSSAGMNSGPPPVPALAQPSSARGPPPSPYAPDQPDAGWSAPSSERPPPGRLGPSGRPPPGRGQQPQPAQAANATKPLPRPLVPFSARAASPSPPRHNDSSESKAVSVVPGGIVSARLANARQMFNPMQMAPPPIGGQMIRPALGGDGVPTGPGRKSGVPLGGVGIGGMAVGGVASRPNRGGAPADPHTLLLRVLLPANEGHVTVKASGVRDLAFLRKKVRGKLSRGGRLVGADEDGISESRLAAGTFCVFGTSVRLDDTATMPALMEIMSPYIDQGPPRTVTLELICPGLSSLSPQMSESAAPASLQPLTHSRPKVRRAGGNTKRDRSAGKFEFGKPS